MTDRARRRAEDQRDQAFADLADIERQLAAGEIDSATRDRLAAVYETEAAAAGTRLDRLEASRDEAPTKRSWKRVAVGTGAFAVLAAVATVAAINAVEPRPEGGFATGGIVSDVLGTPRQLAEVTTAEMEAVIADNPDVVGMRLLLGRRYVEEGDPSAAIAHFTHVLDLGPNAEAFAYLGWIAFLGGEPATADGFLARALEVDEALPEALWFLALVRADGLADPAGAVPLLEQLLDDPQLVGEARTLVVERLDAARDAVS